MCAAFLSVVLTCAGPAGAEDLLHYYNLALKNDPQLRGAYFEHLASRETLRQAYAALLPHAYAEGSYTLTYQDVLSSGNKVYAVGTADYNTQSFGGNLTQPLFRYSSFLGVSQAKSVLKRSDVELEKVRQDLIMRIAEAYMEVLLAQDKLAAVVAEEAALEVHHEHAKGRTTGGMAPITDLYDTEARLAAVRAQRVESENALKDARQALSEICDVPVVETKSLKEDIPLTPPFPENADSWVAAASKQNLEILIEKYKAEIAETETRRQKAAHYPTVDFLANYDLQDTTGSLYGGGSRTSTYYLMFKLTVPIYEGGLTTSKTREACNLHASALEAVTKVTRAVERKARSAYNAVLSASNRVTAMKKSVEAQQMVVAAKEEGFRSGMLISISVLDATQDLYKYKKEYSQARNDYILDTIRLKQTAGTLSEDDIRQVNALLQ
jgi:outer membrane protein